MQFKLNTKIENGTVLLMGLVYEGQTSDKVWTYAWLKAGGLWYGTGNGQVPTAAGWGAVERWLGKSGRRVLWVTTLVQGTTLYQAPEAELTTLQ